MTTAFDQRAIDSVRVSFHEFFRVELVLSDEEIMHILSTQAFENLGAQNRYIYHKHVDKENATAQALLAQEERPGIADEPTNFIPDHTLTNSQLRDLGELTHTLDFHQLVFLSAFLAYHDGPISEVNDALLAQCLSFLTLNGATEDMLHAFTALIHASWRELQADDDDVKRIDDEYEARTNPFWRCEECGHKDHAKPMPTDREAFYAKQQAETCPRCNSEALTPIGL